MADELGLSADDPRGLTVTGGLPFFGGPGNNYAMHAIAETVVRMRERPGGYGLVWANGGVFAKHAAGVWTTRPTPWNRDHGTAIQAEIALAPALGVAEHADGPARIETFAIRRSPRGDHAVVVARLDDGRRFLANPAADDSATAALLESEQALGAPVHASAHGLVNRVAV
jgi:acetyl-CoA C-acetyltransferase